MRQIAILGSTGSIGRSTLSVAEAYPDRFQIVALAAGSNVEAAVEQAVRWKPRVLSIADEADYDTAQALFHDLTGVPFGSERMHTVANQEAEGLTVLDVAPSREEIERRIASVSTGRLRRPVMVLGLDGA